MQPDAERRGRGTFYGGMTVAMSIVVFLGLGPSFYFRSFMAAPPLPSPLVWVQRLRIHDLDSGFLAQAVLVRVHHVRLHRRLGVAGAVLASSMVLLAVTAQIAQTQRVVPRAFRAACSGAPYEAVSGLMLADLFLVASAVHDLRISGRVHSATIRRRPCDA